MNISGRDCFSAPPYSHASRLPAPVLSLPESRRIHPSPAAQKRAHTLLQGRVLIDHLIRVNFRMEVLKAFNEPQPLRPAMSKAKRGISCGQGNTVSSHLPPQRSAARFPADRAGGKNRKKALKQGCCFKIPENGAHRRRNIPFRMPYPGSAPHQASGECPHPDRPASP